MKIRVPQGVLSTAATQVARYISAKPDQPELGGMLLETFEHDGSAYLRLTGFDGKAVGKSAIPVEVDEPGRVLVNGNLFSEVVRDLPSTTITLESDAELVLTAGRGVYKLSRMDSDNYPTLPSMPTETGRIDGQLFASAVGQVARFADKEVEHLMGVRIEVSKDTMTLVATDKYRLAYRTIPWEGPETGLIAYVSAKALTSAAAQFAKGGVVRVAMGDGGNNFGLASADAAVIVQQMEDKFPPGYRQLFTDTYDSSAVVESNLLSEATKRIGRFTFDSAPATFSFDGKELTVRAAAEGVGGAVEPLEIEYEGDPLQISFNPTYLVEALGALGAGKVKLGFNGPLKPTAFKAVTGTGDFVCLVVPVRSV